MARSQRPTRISLLTIGLLLFPISATLAGDVSKQDVNKKSKQNAQSQDADAIRRAIDRELALDPGVRANRIDLRVSDGIVTLEGEVRNILAKERAARIATVVRGVRSVIDRMTVAPTGIADPKLAERVRDALLLDPATELYEVDVSVSDGIVTLTGTVDSWAERDLCRIVASGVTGVRDIDNQILLEDDTERTDSEIRRDILHSLDWSILIDDGLIQVEVKDGAVTLSGVVGSAAEKRRAVRTAYVTGVSKVDAEDLDVDRWARDPDLRSKKYVARPDNEIASAIDGALVRDPRVFSFDIDVDVDSSWVTLSGVVDNLEAKRAAERVANLTVGVTFVDNQIKVRPKADVPDSQIEASVQTALALNPFVDKTDVRVNVYDGWVYLNGIVNDYFTKGQADEAASGVRGVTRVVNQLDVRSEPYSNDLFVDDWNVHNYDWYERGPIFTVKTDAQIERSYEQELYWSPFIDAKDISYDVENGVMTLTGKVDSSMENSAAVDNAYQAGATFVRNRLTIGGDPR